MLEGLPPMLVLPLSELDRLQAALDLPCAEADAARCGHGAAIDRLCELLVIQLLRHLMQHGHAASGVMAGLADPRLERAIAAMHGAP